MSSKTKLEISSFIKGLITEAGPLNFPSDASLVDQNFILLKEGSRRRRKGLQFAKTNPTMTFTESGGYIATMSMHLWKTPSQAENFDIVAVQRDGTLYFFKTKNGALEDNFITSLSVSGYTGSFIMKSANVGGNLIVTFGAQTILVLEYHAGIFPIFATYSRLQIRDIYGADRAPLIGPPPYSTWAVDERPTFPSPVLPTDLGAIMHMYNLRNQGWPLTTVVSTTDTGSEIATQDPTDLTLISTNLKPSLADVIWRAKVTQAASPKAIGAFSPFDLTKHVYGNTQAPRGKFVIDLFDRGASRQLFADSHSGDPTLLLGNDQSSGYINLVASYSGRVFYVVKETSLLSDNYSRPNFATTILFSNTVSKIEDISKCHMQYDPSSEFDFDVLDTDGGLIVIPEAGVIHGIIPLGASLFVIASNGIWEVSGGDSPFSATNQEVRKVSAIGGISSSSIVVAESVVTYWTLSGIYVISIDPSLNRGIVTNITSGTIEKHYLAIPDSQKQKASGYYDANRKVIRWLHNTDTNVPVVGYNHEILFDIDLKAFYTNVYTSTGTYPVNSIITAQTTPDIDVLVHKRIGDTSYAWGFCNYTDTTFKDFGSNDAKAILLTGALTGSAGSLSKQATKLILHLNRTETGFVEGEGGAITFENPSSCRVTPQWEWTNSAAAGKWGETFEGYRLQRPYYPSGVDDPFDYSYTVITSSNGLRGRGRALSLRFESSVGKDLHLLGWGIEIAVEKEF